MGQFFVDDAGPAGPAGPACRTSRFFPTTVAGLPLAFLVGWKLAHCDFLEKSVVFTGECGHVV